MKERNLITPTNKVKFRGTIIGMRASTSSTSFIVITDGGDKKGSTVINVVFYGQLTDTFHIKEHVDIEAHMQSKIKKTDEKTKYFQMVVGDKIFKTKRLLSEYFDFEEFQDSEGGFPDDINKAFVYGKISRIYNPNENYAVITVIVPTDEQKLNYVDVVCYKRQAQLASLLTVGDFVVCVGEIRSSKTKPEKGEILWQSVVCKDIARVNPENANTSIYETVTQTEE